MSVHRDEIHACPRCGQGLELVAEFRYACGAAGKDGEGCGVLMPEPLLQRVVADCIPARPPDFVLPFEPAKRLEATITCPMCTTQMTQHDLFTMHVDRCEQHGVWFDANELASVLLVAEKQHKLEKGDRVRLAVGGIAGATLIALQIVRSIWF